MFSKSTFKWWGSYLGFSGIGACASFVGNCYHFTDDDLGMMQTKRQGIAKLCRRNWTVDLDFLYLGGGLNHPSRKYARQIRSFPPKDRDANKKSYRKPPFSRCQLVLCLLLLMMWANAANAETASYITYLRCWDSFNSIIQPPGFSKLKNKQNEHLKVKKP